MARQQEVTTDDIVIDEVRPDLGKAKDSGLIEAVVPVQGDIAKIAKGEKFYQDMLTVFFHEPANENETPLVEANVNERYLCYRRGQDALIPRYVLEVIARSKVMRVRTERAVDNQGAETMVTKVNYVPVYPFSVTQDPAGRAGAEWLKNILAQPA